MPANGDSTVSLEHFKLGPVCKIVATIVADSGDGSVTATALPSFSGRLLALQTNPGATAPTANYDITLVDDDGLDRLQNVGANRSDTNSEAAAVVYSGTSAHPPVSMGDTLTLTFANNAVNSAEIVVSLYYVSG